MAKNGKPFRDDTWRERIKISMLINRLNDHAIGKIELTPSQIKSIEILLRKTIPDLKAMELYGKDGGAIETKNISENDRVIIQQYLNQKKEVK